MPSWSKQGRLRMKKIKLIGQVLAVAAILLSIAWVMAHSELFGFIGAIR